MQEIFELQPQSRKVLHPADEATAAENLANQVGAVRSVGTA